MKRNAYALLGLAFVILFMGAYVIVERANAPTPAELPDESVTEDEPNYEDPNQEETMLTLTSPAFENNGKIPSKYTCDAENISPPLEISGIPEGTESLILVMDDPDIPDTVKQERGIEKFDHFVLYNISPELTSIPEGEANSEGTLGLTSRGTPGYVGPCPPDREHRYIFRLYAVSGVLNFIQAPTLDEVEEAAKGMTLESATLTGLYERVTNAQ